MKNTKPLRLLITSILFFLFVTLTSFQSTRPIIGWGDWQCVEETNEGLCWKNCHRTYYFIVAIQYDYWSGPCWQSPPSVEL